MKKFVQLLIIAAFILSSSVASAQVCLPDQLYTSPGVYPDSTMGWTPANVGVLYSQVITAVVPDDTTIIYNGFNVDVVIDSIKLLKVDKLPAWLSVACEPPGCSIPGGESGCGMVSGTPPAGSGGVYYMDLITHTYATITAFGIPYDRIDTVRSYFKLVVNGPAGVPVAAAKDPFNFTIIPNPSSGNFKLSVQMPASQEVSVTVLNIIGQAIYTESHNLKRGSNEISVNNLNVPEGNYFVTIKSGTSILTKKLYINY